MSLDVEPGTEYESTTESSPATIEFIEKQFGAKLTLIKDYNPAEYLNPDVYRGLQEIVEARKQNGDKVIESMFVRVTEQENEEYRYGIFVAETGSSDTPSAMGGIAVFGATSPHLRVNR